MLNSLCVEFYIDWLNTELCIYEHMITSHIYSSLLGEDYLSKAHIPVASCKSLKMPLKIMPGLVFLPWR